MEENTIKIIPSDSHLWLSDGRTELAVPLGHGIRIAHFACVGMENLFYEQPEDATYLTTSAGWRVYGGHRFWLAPEGPESYWPDIEPIAWEALPDGVWLHQKEDPWLHVKKSVRVRYLPDGRVELTHRAQNTGAAARRCALWGVSTLAPGGRAVAPFLRDPAAEYTPSRFVALWGETDLCDPRLQFSADSLTAQHLPLDASLKLGLSARAGRVMLENRKQRLVKEFPWQEAAAYPDGGCNFELYLCHHMMELETLGPLVTLQHGQSAEHVEIWSLTAVS